MAETTPTTASTSNSPDLFAAFATDTNAELQGTPVNLPGAGDTLFMVARSGNKAYSKLLAKLWKMNRAVLESKGDAAQAKSEEIMVEILSKTVLLGWQGTVNIKGTPTLYSPEAAKTLLRLKDFQNTVIKVSEDFDTFRKVKEAEDLGN